MPDTGIGVVITGKEIYDAVMETKGTVARIEEKFSSLTSTVRDHTVALEEHDDKLEDLTASITRSPESVVWWEVLY